MLYGIERLYKHKNLKVINPQTPSKPPEPPPMEFEPVIVR
jgi:hypothetical protein